MQQQIQNLYNPDHTTLHFITADVLPTFLPSQALTENALNLTFISAAN